jgi:hypothetical protein
MVWLCTDRAPIGLEVSVAFQRPTATAKAWFRVVEDSGEGARNPTVTRIWSSLASSLNAEHRTPLGSGRTEPGEQ